MDYDISIDKYYVTDIKLRLKISYDLWFYNIATLIKKNYTVVSIEYEILFILEN